MKVHGRSHGHHNHASEVARQRSHHHRAEQRKAAGTSSSSAADDAQGPADLQQLAALLQQLQSLFGDGFDPSTSTGGAGGAGGAGGGGSWGTSGGAGSRVSSGAGNTGVVNPSRVVSGAGTSGIQTNDPRLAQALDLIYSDPDGKKLIDAAKAQGLTQIVTNKGLNPDGGAGTQGETISGANGQRIEIADAGSANLIQTLAHELGHAATPGDGDSQTEEATVDRLGNAIQQRLIGRAANFQLDASAYSNLAVNNGIALDLRQLGIIVP